MKILSWNFPTYEDRLTCFTVHSMYLFYVFSFCHRVLDPGLHECSLCHCTMPPQFVSLLIQSKLQIPGHLKSSPCTSLTKFFVYLLIFSFFFLVCVWSFCVSVYGTGDWNHEHHTERYVPAPGRFYLIVQAGYELESLLPESCRILV